MPQTQNPTNAPGPTPPQGQTPHDDEIDLMALIAPLFFYKWWILAVTLVFLLIGLFIGYVSTPIYKADALIQVEKKAGGVPGLDEMAEIFGAEPVSVTEIEILKSRSTLGKVVKNLNLQIVAQAKYFPILGAPIARRFTPTPNQTLATPFIGLGRYAWGGETLIVDQLEVSNNLMGKALTLIAGKKANTKCFTMTPCLPRVKSKLFHSTPAQLSPTMLIQAVSTP